VLLQSRMDLEVNSLVSYYGTIIKRIIVHVHNKRLRGGIDILRPGRLGDFKFYKINPTLQNALEYILVHWLEHGFRTKMLLLEGYTGCPKNSGPTVHYGVEETTVNVRKMFKKFYWTYLLIGRSLNVALNRKIILKYMY
jgi:hypothetical protein